MAEYHTVKRMGIVGVVKLPYPPKKQVNVGIDPRVRDTFVKYRRILGDGSFNLSNFIEERVKELLEAGGIEVEPCDEETWGGVKTSTGYAEVKWGEFRKMEQRGEIVEVAPGEYVTKDLVPPAASGEEKDAVLK